MSKKENSVGDVDVLLFIGFLKASCWSVMVVADWQIVIDSLTKFWSSTQTRS